MDKKELFFIGKNIKKWRKIQKLTQEKLALRAKISQRYIDELESGKIEFSRNSLIKIAGALGVPVNTIFKETGSIKIVRSYDKKAKQKGPVTQYVIMKPELYEKEKKLFQCNSLV